RAAGIGKGHRHTQAALGGGTVRAAPPRSAEPWHASPNEEPLLLTQEFFLRSRRLTTSAPLKLRVSLSGSSLSAQKAANRLAPLRFLHQIAMPPAPRPAV